MGLLVMLMGYCSTLKSRCVNVSWQKIKRSEYKYIYKRVNSEPIKRNRQSRISSCLLLKKLASFTKKNPSILHHKEEVSVTFNSFLSASVSCCSSVLVASTALSNSATFDSADVSHVRALIMSSWNRTMRSNASLRFFLRESDLKKSKWNKSWP